MSWLRIGFDLCAAHCYHLILIGEPISLASVLQRKAVFSVCLAFLWLPSLVACIISSTVSSVPVLSVGLKSAEQPLAEGQGFLLLPQRPHFPAAGARGTVGRGEDHEDYSSVASC